MTDALTTMTKAELTNTTDAVIAMISGADKFLPRLQLCTANTKECKSGKFPINHYALVNGNTFIDLNDSVDMLVYSYRPKALDMSNEEAIISVYDTGMVDGQSTGEFRRIQLQADVKDSGCMFGIEFLVWIPDRATFATFFFGTKTSRREVPSMVEQIGKGATAKAQLIKTKKYEYYSIAITPCTRPMDLPDEPTLTKTLEDFKNPPKSNVEAASSADKAATTRDR